MDHHDATTQPSIMTSRRMPVEVWKQVMAFHAFENSTSDCFEEEFLLRKLSKLFYLSLPIPTFSPTSDCCVHVGYKAFQFHTMDGAVEHLSKQLHLNNDNSQPTKEIQVGKGVFYINNKKSMNKVGELVIPFDLKITGVSPTESYILGSFTFPAMKTNEAEQGDEGDDFWERENNDMLSFELMNLTLCRGPVDPEYNSDYGINADRCYGVNIKATNCGIRNFSCGIFLDPSGTASKLDLKQCHFEENDIALEYQGGGLDQRNYLDHVLSLVNCTFYQNSESAIVVSDVATVNISGAHSSISRTGFGEFRSSGCSGNPAFGSIQIHSGVHLNLLLPVSHVLYFDNAGVHNDHPNIRVDGLIHGFATEKARRSLFHSEVNQVDLSPEEIEVYNNELSQIVNNNKVSLECRYNDDEKFLNYLYLDEKD